MKFVDSFKKQDEAKSGLFDVKRDRGSIEFRSRFDCSIGGEKLYSVSINDSYEKAEDVYVCCYYDQSDWVRRYKAGIEEMTKAEMVGHLESIMKQANEELKKREESNSVNRNDIAGEN